MSRIDSIPVPNTLKPEFHVRFLTAQDEIASKKIRREFSRLGSGIGLPIMGVGLSEYLKTLFSANTFQAASSLMHNETPIIMGMILPGAALFLLGAFISRDITNQINNRRYLLHELATEPVYQIEEEPEIVSQKQLPQIGGTPLLMPASLQSIYHL